MRLIGVEYPPAHEQVARDLMAYLPYQNRRNQRRYKADAYFGISEFSFGHGEGEVAHRRDPRSAGYGGTVDGGDGRFGEIVETSEELRHVPRIRDILLLRLAHQRLQLVKIHARAKGFARSREDGNRRVAFFDLIEGPKDFIDHAKANGVAPVRTIEGNGRDPGVLRELESLELHGTGQEIIQSIDGEITRVYLSLRRTMSSACCE